MKNKIIIWMCGVLLLTSCDDYFDTTMKGSVKEDDFYENLNNLRIGLNSVYNLMQSERYQRGDILFGEAISDNCWNLQDVESGDVSDILNFRFNTENPYILERYQVNYEGINKVNQIIRSIPHVKYLPNGNSEKEIREVYGQAKMLRALFYFNLVKTFGGVSIQPEQQELGSLIVKRSTLDEVYAYIEKDLRESLLLLRRQRYTLGEAGQSGIGAGLGLLMKVLLYEASPGTQLKTVDKEAKWQEALEIGSFFIDGKDLTAGNLLKFENRYTESWNEVSKRLFLDRAMTAATVIPGQDVVSIHQLDKFDNLFRVKGEFCPESLLEINHYDFSGTGISDDESWKMNGYITDDTKGGVVNITPSKDLYSLFDKDPRKLFTIVERSINNYFKQETSNPAIFWFGTGDALKFSKYYVFPSEGDPEVRNYRVMRYAEVLLIYAEVLNQTGDSRRAVDMVNRLRKRARELFNDNNPNKQYQTSSVADFKDVSYAPFDIVQQTVLKEKRIEMAGEFDRWFELCRLGIVAERMREIAKNPPVEPSGQTRVRGKYFRKGVNEIFPIPQKEVFISNGVIEQNFGY